MSAIRLIVGLGNPGPEYANTRHNAGFWLLDELAKQCRLTLKIEEKFMGEAACMQTETGGLWLFKPLSFMNRSGQGVAALSRYYKIAPQHIVIVHDDLDLPPGRARFKQGGGHGGHNGLKDIIARLGTADFWRLRLGIGRPRERTEVRNFVLTKASTQDRLELEQAISRALAVLPLALGGDLAQAMQRLHTNH